MSTFIITPSTTATPISSTDYGYTLGQCKNLCSKDNNCTAFVYQQSSGGCNIIHTSLSTLSTMPATSDFGLYIKGSRSNFWWVWLFFGILIILLFFMLCKKR